MQDEPKPLDQKDLTTGPLLYVNFNQDQGCFACGTENGFSVYSTDPIKRRFKRDFDSGIGIVEILFRCNIVALVGGGKHPKFPANRVMVWDDYQNKCIAELECRSEVKAVKLRYNRVIVVMDEQVFVYNFSDLQLLRQIKTSHNPKGLCAISTIGDNIVLVCPAMDVGHVRVEIYDPSNNTNQIPEIIIPAHQGELGHISLTPDGKFLATASHKGTLIRVYDPATGTKLKEFRRGNEQAQIYSIAFSKDEKYLCCSSSSGRGTIHIFAWDQPGQAKLSFMQSFVPYLGSWWSFSQFSIVAGVKSICCFSPKEDEKNTIIVVCSNGYYYKFKFDETGQKEPTRIAFDYFLTKENE